MNQIKVRISGPPRGTPPLRLLPLFFLRVTQTDSNLYDLMPCTLHLMTSPFIVCMREAELLRCWRERVRCLGDALPRPCRDAVFVLYFEELLLAPLVTVEEEADRGYGDDGGVNVQIVRLCNVGVNPRNDNISACGKAKTTRSLELSTFHLAA